MKNKLFWALLGVVVVIFIILVLGAFSGLQTLGLSDPVAAACSLGFLLVAFVAWEYLMKPGYGFLHRRREIEEVRDEESGEQPSPGAP